MSEKAIAASSRRTAQRAQGITGCHLRSGQSVDLGLPHLSGAHAGRPSAGDRATARCDAARGANRAARAREVLRLARRRAKGAVQTAQLHMTPLARSAMGAHAAAIVKKNGVAKLDEHDDVSFY